MATAVLDNRLNTQTFGGSSVREFSHPQEYISEEIEIFSRVVPTLSTNDFTFLIDSLQKIFKENALKSVEEVKQKISFSDEQADEYDVSAISENVQVLSDRLSDIGDDSKWVEIGSAEEDKRRTLEMYARIDRERANA